LYFNVAVGMVVFIFMAVGKGMRMLRGYWHIYSILLVTIDFRWAGQAASAF
jgi:hypothetical protein